MIRKIFMAAALVAAMSGCQQDDSANIEQPSGAITFSSLVAVSRVTTMEDESGKMAYAWESGDQVGISTSGLGSDFTNVGYKATTTITSLTTTFEAIDSASQIAYPDGFEGEVTFSAYFYFPYASDQESFFIDLCEQNEEEETIFLVASTTKSVASDDLITDVAFEFTHILSQLIINFEVVDDSIGELESIYATIFDVVSSCSYNRAGESVGDEQVGELYAVATIDSQSNTAQIKMLLHPNCITDTSRMKLLVNNDVYYADFLTEVEAGQEYTLTVKLGE
ncbi:MAG: fimbrillin family protein [Rikenellaceae bacterium]